MTAKQHQARLAQVVLELWIRDPSLLEGDSELIQMAERAAGRDLVGTAQKVLPWAIKHAPSCPSWPYLKTKEIEDRLLRRVWG